jgi:hypothetical protein
MSAILAELTRLHPDKDERLLAASSVIVRLETEAATLRIALAGAIDTMESFAVALRTPPLPLPKAADSLETTAALLRETLRRVSTRAAS